MAIINKNKYSLDFCFTKYQIKAISYAKEFFGFHYFCVYTAFGN